MSPEKKSQPDPATGWRHFKHVCSVCGREFPKDQLVAKRVQFLPLGRNAKPLKVRTVAWLCPEHLEADDAWQQPAMAGSPIRRQELAAEPGLTTDQIAVGTPVASLADAQPGDLVFFGDPKPDKETHAKPTKKPAKKA